MAPMVPNEARERRRRRAAIAARLLAGGADAVCTVDWDTLSAAPAWLAMTEDKRATLQRQIGALLYAPEIRLWIDGARLGAARVALGESFLQALLAQRDLLSFPNDSVARPRIDLAEQVPAHLQLVGTAVLLASLPAGPLQHAVGAALGSTAAAPIAVEMARSLVARAQALAAHGRSTPRPEAAPGVHP